MNRWMAILLLLWAAPPAAAAEEPLRVIAFGDSLTAGKDLDDPDRQAYPAVLQELLNRRGRGRRLEVVNAGHSGDTTFDALARLDYALAEGADVVLVALGSNDTFQGKRLEDIEKNLTEILRRVRAKGASPLLLAMRTFPNLGPDYAGGYEEIFPRVARKQGVPLAPFFMEGVAGVEAMLLSDRLHPNAAGHRRMAENLLPYVGKVISGRKGAP